MNLQKLPSDKIFYHFVQQINFSLYLLLKYCLKTVMLHYVML